MYVDGRLVETELNSWVRRFWTEDELETELNRAGFVDVAISSTDESTLVVEAHRRA